MLEGPAPPFIEPFGPFLDDMAVLQAFVQGRPAGHSTRFHVERPSLLLERTVAAALRIDDDTVLVRADLPDDLRHCKGLIESALTVERLSCLDEDTLLGLPVALQVVGLRLSSWDLWGANIDDAFSALRGAAVMEMRSVLR
ncbi:MAG: hypothetical protein KY454_11630 [Actinobacteria bacterium]|nr:hypothetical protein [Actinomycetota bacterium]